MAGLTIGPYQVMTSRADLRIGTAERERAANLLGQHLSAGRLELAEFDERVRAAYAARTERDLAVLFGDLPESEPSNRRLGGRRRKPKNPYALGLIVLLALGVVAMFTAFPPLFLLPLAFVALRIRRHRIGYGRPSAQWQPARRA